MPLVPGDLAPRLRGVPPTTIPENYRPLAWGPFAADRYRGDELLGTTLAGDLWIEEDMLRYRTASRWFEFQMVGQPEVDRETLRATLASAEGHEQLVLRPLKPSDAPVEISLTGLIKKLHAELYW
jgi:hypothetical protein